MQLIPCQIYELKHPKFGTHRGRLALVSQFCPDKRQNLFFELFGVLPLKASESGCIVSNGLPMIREPDGRVFDIVTETPWEISLVSPPNG